MKTKTMPFLVVAVAAAAVFLPGLVQAEIPVLVMAGAVAANQTRLLTVNQGGDAAPALIRTAAARTITTDGGVRHVIVSQPAAPAYVWQQLDPESQKIKDQFLADTVTQRKSLAEKKAALRTMQNSTKGDVAATTRLAGEIFELREQLRIEAHKTGLPDNVLFSMPVDPGYTGNIEEQ